MTSVKESKKMLMQSLLDGKILSFFDLVSEISYFAEADAVAGCRKLPSVSPEQLIAVKAGGTGPAGTAHPQGAAGSTGAQQEMVPNG